MHPCIYSGLNGPVEETLVIVLLSWAIGEGNGTPLQYSCLENPWTEEPGRLQSMGSLRVGHDWATSLSLLTFMHWRRKWQPTPAFLPEESQGWGSLVGCRLWRRTESDTTEATEQQQQQQQQLSYWMPWEWMSVPGHPRRHFPTWMWKHLTCKAHV